MLSPFPAIRLSLLDDTHPDGDDRHEVIAVVSGIPAGSVGELFAELCAHVPHLRARLSLTHADSVDQTVGCEPAKVPDLAIYLARVAIAATWDEAIRPAKAVAA